MNPTIQALTAAILALVPQYRTPNGEIEILQDATQIVGWATAYGIEPELVAAVAMAESSFRRDAESATGAVGLMGIRNPTAAQRVDYTANIHEGVRLLALYTAKCGAKMPGITAYNLGRGRNGKNCRSSAYSARVVHFYETIREEMEK